MATDPQEDLAAAISAAVARLDEPVRKRLATWAGYGGGATAAAAWVLEQSTRWNLPPVLQGVLLTGAFGLFALTGLGRQLQAASSRKGLAQVAASAVAPVQVSPAQVLAAGLNVPVVYTSTGPYQTGSPEGDLPAPDEVIS